MAIYYFDREMVNVSIGLAQVFTFDMLIDNIIVSMTKKVYATIKNENHHSLTP